MSTSSSVPSLAEMLKSHPITLLPNNKIVCKVTGHEMPARPDVVHAYLSGGKYKKQLSWYSYNFDEFLPFIVPQKGNNKLVCTLTNQTLNRIPEEVKKHMSGKKFLRLKAEYEEKQKNRKNKKHAVADKEDDAEDDEELEIPDDIAAEVGVKGSKGKSKKSTKTKPEEAEGDEDSVDNLSDLMGSDIEEGDEDDVSEEEEEQEEVQESEESEDEAPRKKQKTFSRNYRNKKQVPRGSKGR